MMLDGQVSFFSQKRNMKYAALLNTSKNFRIILKRNGQI
jgi:hypothetical protein